LQEARAVATQGINLFRVLMTWLAPVMPGIAARAEQWLGAGTLSRWDATGVPLLGNRLGKYPQLASRLDPAVVQQLVIQQTAQPAAASDTGTKAAPAINNPAAATAKGA